MTRTTISLPEDLIKQLRIMAAEQRTSMAAIIREALQEKTKSHRPRPRGLGMFASEYTDTAAKAGEIRPVPRQWR